MKGSDPSDHQAPPASDALGLSHFWLEQSGYSNLQTLANWNLEQKYGNSSEIDGKTEPEVDGLNTKSWFSFTRSF